MKFLTRLAVVAPLVFISAVKFVPNLWSSIVSDVLVLAPGSDLPPDDVMLKIGMIEAAASFFVAVGLAPRLFHTLAAAHYLTPIILLKGDCSGIGQLYVFVLALHAACAGILLFDAWGLKELTRIAVMQAPLTPDRTLHVLSMH